MSSQQIISKEQIINRIRNNDPIISRILSTKTCNYEDYIKSIYDTSSLKENPYNSDINNNKYLHKHN